MIPPFKPWAANAGSHAAGFSLRAPQQLLAGLKQTVMKGSAAPDRLNLSAVSSRLASQLPAQSLGLLPSLASAKPAPSSSGTEYSFDGVQATIHWDRRFRQAKGESRIPTGYEVIKGTLPKGLSQAATAILKQGNPLGTYTPFSLGGKNYIALNEYHTHYAGRPNDPPGQIYAITVFQQS